MGIPVVAIVDTNVDPEPIPYIIPANDDAFKSIGLITRTLTDAIIEGQVRVQEERPAVEFEERAPARAESEAHPSRRPPKRVRRRTTTSAPETERKTESEAPEATRKPPAETEELPEEEPGD